MAEIRDEVVRIITSSIRELNAALDVPVELDGEETSLYGDDGALDSLGLVTLISAVEQGIEDDLGVVVSLTDERALSQARSPFRTVGSLADFAVDLFSSSPGAG